MKLPIASLLLLSFTCSMAQKNDSLDLKIGQLIMIGINDRTSINDNDSLLTEIRADKVGGIILFEKNISKTDSKTKLIETNTKLQKAAAIPLFISIDEEGGKVHRLKEKYGFVAMPSAMYLGNLNNTDSTYEYNLRLSKELNELGFNLNYAPCLDLALNPDNKVIVQRERSFSSDPKIVSTHALSCIKAHHKNKVGTIIKHFPGHGSSTGDSHKGIVNVTGSWDLKEIFPYYDVVRSGECDAIMTAHIINKHWDTLLLPATLSEKTIQGLIRNLLLFDGVIFSDDMQMYAISKNYGLEKALELSLNAGVDVLVFGNNVDPKQLPITASEIHRILKKLVLENKISISRINESYKRVIRLKNKVIQ